MARPIDVVRKLCPKAKPAYLAAIENGNALFRQHGITTPLRLAHFLAQICHESGGLTIEWESGNYSAERLLEIFGEGVHSARITPSEAQRLARRPEAIFERVYGLGNPKKAKELGNTQPGDGYRYRGGGLMQTTGRANYRRMGVKCGVDFEGCPDLVLSAEHALKPALAEWSQGNLNAAADRDDIRAITRKINGGYNGLPDREAWLAKFKRTIEAVDLGDPQPAPLPEPVPLPQPKPSVPDQETEPPPPQPAPPALPWWHPKRIWLWITGGGAGVGAFAWVTDPWAWAKLFLALGGFTLVCFLIAMAVAVMLFGRKRTAEYIRSWLPRRER